MKSVATLARELQDECGAPVDPVVLLALVRQHASRMGHVEVNVDVRSGRPTPSTVFVPPTAEANWRHEYHRHFARLAREALERDRG